MPLVLRVSKTLAPARSSHMRAWMGLTPGRSRYSRESGSEPTRISSTASSRSSVLPFRGPLRTVKLAPGDGASGIALSARTPRGRYLIVENDSRPRHGEGQGDHAAEALIYS